MAGGQGFVCWAGGLQGDGTEYGGVQHLSGTGNHGTGRLAPRAREATGRLAPRAREPRMSTGSTEERHS